MATALRPYENPLIYDNEVRVTAPAGSLFIYSMRTFHRGTLFRADVGRIAQFATYCPKNYRWLGIVGWPRNAIRREFRDWIERAAVEERSALAFPAPGDPYWTEETLAGVGARYPGMDMSPYRRATLAEESFLDTWPGSRDDSGRAGR